MKKFLSLFLALVMMFLTVGCNLDSSDETTELSRGTIEGDVYSNDYLDFQFTKPESWVYATDDEIAEAMSLGADLMLEENFKDALEDNVAVYDMMVVDTLTGSNISVGYENLAKTFATNITEDQYAEALQSQLENVSGMSVEFPDTYDTVKLGKTEFTRVLCTTTAYDITMTQIYYLHKIDGYMSYIIVTVLDGYDVVDVEAMFQ